MPSILELLEQFRAMVPIHSGEIVAEEEVVYENILLPSESWDKSIVESTLGVVLPAEVGEFWDICSSLYLLQDATFGQSGLFLWSAEYVLSAQATMLATRDDHYILGDLVLGVLIGISEMVVVRCDPQDEDYGSITIALEIYPREDWPIVASSLSEFLAAYWNNNGGRYWEDSTFPGRRRRSDTPDPVNTYRPGEWGESSHSG